MLQDVSIFSEVHKKPRSVARQLLQGRNMVDDTQALLRVWIEKILRERDITKTGLARKAGVAVTTVTRLFEEDYVGTMNASSIAKIVRATGIPAPRNLGGVDGPQGFGEAEISPIDMTNHTEAHISEWTINSHSMILAGFLPGDRITVSDNITPHSGDIVIAQLYNNERGTAETVIRVWLPPYLTAASTNLEDRRPVLVDNNNVMIRGVVTKTVRTRKSS